MSMNVSAQEVMNAFSDQKLLNQMLGGPDTLLKGIASVEMCRPGDLVFADKKEYVSIIEARRPAAVVTSAKFLGEYSKLPDLVIFIASHFNLAHAKIKAKYASRNYELSGWSNIHPSAVVHESVKIGIGVTIEPRAVIGQNVKIGNDVRIMAGVVIENDVCIGDNTIIQPCAVIGYSCVVGSDVLIGSGSVIGSEGYGFAQDLNKKSFAIPQTGIVVIEDRVRVGANNCIDRAAYFETRIGAGTKLDNLCHIAHNVTIGEDCLLTSMLCVAGSTKIGNRVITSGQTGIVDHVTICDDVVLLYKAGVNKDISSPGAYAGTPIAPLNEFMKNTAVLRSAADLKKRVIELEKNKS
jgi:UDP-3-O-[3-hydroxymyristoyl] glucosamine N-acyltransferase